jgi:hypothetical protein
VFDKAKVLREKWTEVIQQADVQPDQPGKGHLMNVCDWMGRLTFDVMGSAGFDYEFDAINDGNNELLRAYADMFETAISRDNAGLRGLLELYVPILAKLFVSSHDLYLAPWDD